VSLADIKVDILDYPRDWVELDHTQMVIKSGNIQELDINLKGEKEGTEFKKSITLEINGEKESRFTIPILKKIPLKP
jgi:hypothetical protein